MICQQKMTEKLVLNPRFRLSRDMFQNYGCHPLGSGGPDIFWNDGQTASFATSAYMFWHLGRAGVWQFCYGAVWIPSQISKGIPSQKQDPTIQV